MMSGKVAEVILRLFALKLTAFHQLIHFAPQGFERTTGTTGESKPEREQAGHKDRPVGQKRKTVQLPFPTFFLVADEGEGIIGNFNSARFDSVRR